MRAWEPPTVPRPPGESVDLRLFDTASQTVKPMRDRRERQMYVCGITPYDATHIGHANTYVSFDLIHRMWLDQGREVTFVQNVTDVDDPLLDRARATGQDWQALAEGETALFRDDMKALHVMPPQHYVGAVESIPLVIKHVERLSAAGDTYIVDDDLYFEVHRDLEFGGVSHLDEPTMIELFAERGGDPGRKGKRHVLDCLVWQAEKPDEPAWVSPFGRGRPGWHIECAAIALEFLGTGIDVQGGGSDLIFPHHEMSVSECHRSARQVPFAHHYVHSGMVSLQGHKMSKSRGNLVLVRRLRDQGIDAAVIRLALLAHHYREDWEWVDGDVSEAQARLHAWRRALTVDDGPASHGVIRQIRELLADDLQAPRALAVVDRWVNEAATGENHEPDQARHMRDAVDGLLGVKI